MANSSQLLQEEVTLAVLRNDIKHLTKTTELGFDRVTSRLDILNGKVAGHETEIVVHENKIGKLEEFQDGLRTSLTKWGIAGLSIGAGFAAVLWGIGKAAGWW